MACKTLVLMLCVGLMVASAAGSELASRRLLDQPSTSNWFSGSTWTQNNANAGAGSSGSASSGSGSSVSTNGGSGSASSSSSSAVVQAAASACASATASAFQATNVCKSSVWSFDDVQAAASACAKALVNVALSGSSSSYASGNTQSCANSRSSVQASASAVASAAADAIAQASGHCTQVQAYVYSDAWTSAFVDVCATALTTACSHSSTGSSPTSAYASVYASLHTMASAVASAYGRAYSAACANNCGAYSSCGSCPFVGYDAGAVSSTFVAVTDGKYAVTTGMADAVAKSCGDHQYTAHAQEVAHTCTEVCLQAYFNLHSISYSSSGSWSCATLWVEAELKAMASAVVEIAAGAMATNWGSTCASVVSVTQAAIRANAAQSLTTLIINTFSSACTHGGSVSISTVIDAVVTNSDLVNALSNSWADASAQCLCNNPGCCSTCNLADTCSALVPKP